MALSPRAAQPVRGYDEEYCADKPTGRRIGISLSGGGIRSAAFNLGALQALQEEEVLGSAQYLAAVSGGGYIASALTISHAYAEPGAEDGHPLWAHGSPEERLLRRNTNYLAPGTAGRTWLVMNVLHGFVLNYLPFLLSGFVIGRVLGWLAHLAGVSLAHPPSSLVLVPLYGVGVFVLAAVAVVARARWRDGHKGVRGYGESSLEKWAALCIRLAGLALGVLALPWLAALYGAGTRAVLGHLGLPVDEPLSQIAAAGGWLLIALALAGIAVPLARRPRARWVVFAAAVLASGALLGVPLLASLEYATRVGISGWDVVGVVAAAAVVLLMAIKVHNRRYSMHLFYRERLNSALSTTAYGAKPSRGTWQKPLAAQS